MAAVKKAAKKFAKKAAKKTYPPAKKTVPKPKWVTAKELSAIMVKTFDRMAAHSAETEAKMAALHAQIEAAMDARHAKIEAELAARRAEIEAESAKRRATMEAESAKHRAAMEAEHAKTMAEIQKLSDENRKLTKSLDSSFGGLSRRLGRLTELIVVPKLRLDMNALGHNFTGSLVDRLIRGVVNGRKEDLAEVDMLLCGPAEVMAVEIKTYLRETGVRDHLDRLRVLRNNEEDADIKGRKLYGAVVGIAIDNTARELAKENGLYVVDIREEEDKLIIDKPEQCRVW